MSKSKGVRIGFEDDCVLIPISAIHPLKTHRPTIKASVKFRQILTSIKAVGLVEAPVVTPDRGDPGAYLLLDGHLRIEALKDMGVTEVSCLISSDDEAYTYNKRISRITAAQEHKMIRRAIERGVPEQKLADALGLDIQSIRRRARLLNGICPEAAELMKETNAPMVVFDVLRLMKPLRQIEAAELMVGQHNFSRQFANALLVATPEHQLVKSKRAPKAAAPSREQMIRLERELSALQAQIKTVEETFGIETLHLTVAKRYLSRLLGSGRLVRWLAQYRPEYLGEFQAIAELKSISAEEVLAAE